MNYKNLYLHYKGAQAVEIQTILDYKTVKTNMMAKDKDDALLQLSNVLKKEGYITDEQEFMKDIYAREAEGMTGIGNYISIPHGRSAAVKKIGVAIGILNEEIKWESLDNKGVKGIILFAVGNDTSGAEHHLKLLAMFARKLGNDEVVNSLLEANTQQEVIEAFK